VLTTASALKASPLENLTSLRSVNSQWVGSTFFQLSARIGVASPAALMRTSGSKIASQVKIDGVPMPV
jgi:hypothetical protein